jgi:hypothetical protein
MTHDPGFDVLFTGEQQSDGKGSVHLMIAIQKVTTHVFLASLLGSI